MGIRNTFGRQVESLEPFDEHLALIGGMGAGVVGAIAMGVTFMALDGSLLRESIPGLYGLEGSLVAGWALHLVHGALFGLVFAVVMDDPSLVRVSDYVWKSTIAGVVFGLVLAIVGMGVIMPMWSQAAGLSLAMDIPFVTAPLLVGHLVFGAVIGAVFPFVDRF